CFWRKRRGVGATFRFTRSSFCPHYDLRQGFGVSRSRYYRERPTQRLSRKRFTKFYIYDSTFASQCCDDTTSLSAYGASPSRRRKAATNHQALERAFPYDPRSVD